jgi:hypothetical protein
MLLIMWNIFESRKINCHASLHYEALFLFLFLIIHKVTEYFKASLCDWEIYDFD